MDRSPVGSGADGDNQSQRSQERRRAPAYLHVCDPRPVQIWPKLANRHVVWAIFNSNKIERNEITAVTRELDDRNEAGASKQTQLTTSPVMMVWDAGSTKAHIDEVHR